METGIIDLAVLAVDGATLLRGLGDCRFEPADERVGVRRRWRLGDRLQRDVGGRRRAAHARHRPLPDVGRPRAAASFACDDNLLVRPEPGGVARYAPPIPLSPGFCTLSILFSDWDRSGRRDLRVTNDRQYYRDGQEQLWRDRARRGARLYTARRRLGARCRSGGWASPAATSPATATRRCTSRARATTSSRP